MKHFAEKSFSVFGGLTWAPSKQTKTFSILMKNNVQSFQDFCSQKYADLVKICVFVTCNTF